MRFLRLPALLLAALFLLASPDEAAARSVEWERYDVSLTLNDDGSYHVIERQAVEFTDGPFTFAFAEIPTTRVDDLVNVRVSEERDGRAVVYEEVGASRNDEDAETYVVEPSRDAIRITWYMPRTVDETRTFVLEYDVIGNLRVYADETGQPRQQIWWTAIGEEVTAIARIREASFVVELPSPVDPAAVILDGPGADEAAAHTEDGRTFTWTASNLDSGDQLEARLEFPAIVAAEAPAWQEADDDRRIREEEVEGRRTLINVLAFAAGLLTFTAGGVGVYGLWYARGRDPGVGAVASYLAQPPDDLAPGAAGALIDEVVNPHDIIATLLDLGHRGILTIEDAQSSQLGGVFTTHDFRITRTDKKATLKPFEQTLLTALMGSDEPGRTVELSDVKQRFDANAELIRDQLYDELVRHGYFVVSPETTRSRWSKAGCSLLGGAIAVGVVAVGALSRFTDLAIVPFIAVAAIGILVLVVAKAMPKKSQQGAEDAAKWRAFKRYLDDIEQYEQVDEATEIFNRYLPYAVAFGIERGFVTKFAAVGADVPEWFGGGMATGMPGEFGGYGRRGRGPVVITNWGGGGFGQGGGAFGQSGGASRGSGGDGGDGGDGGGDGDGGFDIPDLQQTSDKGLGGLQGLSGGLFDLLDEAGSAFGGFSGGGGGRHGGFSGGGGGFGGGGGGGGGGGRGFG